MPLNKETKRNQTCVNRSDNVKVFTDLESMKTAVVR